MLGTVNKKKISSKTLLGSQKGFTLLELSIVIVIIGFLVSSFLMANKVYMQQEKLKITQENIDVLVNRISSAPCDGPDGSLDPYTNSCYPCPARLDLAPEDAGFGDEVDCLAAVPPLHTCVDGICRVQGLGGAEVLVGAVPFKAFTTNFAGYVDDNTLSQNASLREMYDGWSRNYTYYVTLSMTDPATYDKDLGAVNVVDENGTSLLETFNGQQYGAHFAVVSHGEDGRGGYINGNLPLGCDLNTADSENCDHLLGAPNADGTVLMGIRRRAPGATYFDDVVSFRVSYDDDLWEYDYDTTTLYTLNSKFVGINDDDPTDKLVIGANAADGVESSLYATEVHVGEYCVTAYRDENGDTVIDDLDRTCFNTDLIGSTRDNCNSSNAMTGIRNNTKECRNIEFQNPSLIDADPSASACATASSFVTEVNLDWGVLCN